MGFGGDVGATESWGRRGRSYDLFELDMSSG